MLDIVWFSLMEGLIDKYVTYIRDIRRYSVRTVDIYERAVRDFAAFAADGDTVISDDELVDSMKPNLIRNYEFTLLEQKPPMSPRTVSLHLSALSGFCRYLMKEGKLGSNPVKLVVKPKVEKRLPHFFKKDAMEDYFVKTQYLVEPEFMKAFETSEKVDSLKKPYESLLSRVIVSALYSLGVRRAELIELRVADVDFGRNVVKVHGKGDKMREIPLVVSLSEEILLYLKAVETVCGGKRSLTEPLLVTFDGKGLYPSYVDRVIKKELGDIKGITGRKSPHVLRHSLATELLNEEADLNSIKELLGHSSLAATQVYTHSSIARLKTIYEHAHPRAKNGGKHGD